MPGRLKSIYVTNHARLVAPKSTQQSNRGYSFDRCICKWNGQIVSEFHSGLDFTVFEVLFEIRSFAVVFFFIMFIVYCIAQ